MNTLTPLAQAGYHAGCAARHLARAALALWEYNTTRIVILLLAAYAGFHFSP